jgi:hypothetical protein
MSLPLSDSIECVLWRAPPGVPRRQSCRRTAIKPLSTEPRPKGAYSSHDIFESVDLRPA